MFKLRPLLIVITLMMMNHAEAQAPACFEIFQLQSQQTKSTAISSLFNGDKHAYLDYYNRAQHEKNFWNYHSRFGVYRTEQGAIILQAKTQEMGEQILKDLLNYTGGSMADVVQTHKPGWFNKTVAYDITNVLPQLLRDRIEVAGKNPGPNCINNCMLMAKHSTNIVYQAGRELKLVLDSAFARPITDVTKLRPGDLLIINTINPVGASKFFHAAIFISPELTLSKNGLHERRPVRLMDMQEMLRLTLNMSQKEISDVGGIGSYRVLRAYRLLPVEEVLAKAGLTMPDNFSAAKAEFETFERALSDFYASGNWGHLAQLKIDYDLLDRRWHTAIHKAQDEINASGLRTDQKDLLLTLWEGLSLRLKSYRDTLISQGRTQE